MGYTKYRWQPATITFLIVLLASACNRPLVKRLPHQTFALLVNLKNDPAGIAAYQNYHRHIFPEVENAFRKAGILDMKIYLFGHQTFLVMETTPGFSLDRDLPKISGGRIDEWDRIMSRFQDLKGDEKWVPVTLMYHMQEK